jgi:hypothetical protein
MLPLDHPLWRKLDDAHRDRDIPQLLAKLSEAWDDESARSLFWDCLCHQGTCYGATYAAIPHLLTIAQVDANRHQRLEIALFCGYVALCALTSADKGEVHQLPGLPQSLKEWDQKLDCYRDLVLRLEDPGRRASPYERTTLLPRYRQVLLAGSIAETDLDAIGKIRLEFLSCLTTVSETCERALLENLEHENVVMPLLGGIAAADGYLDLGHLFYQGKEGWLKCTHCRLDYQYALFGTQVVLYAEERSSTPAAAIDQRPLLDLKEGAASRCDGFVTPVDDDKVLAPSIGQLILLADRAQSRVPGILLRNFIGSFRCRCGDASVAVCGG